MKKQMILDKFATYYLHGDRSKDDLNLYYCSQCDGFFEEDEHFFMNWTKIHPYLKGKKARGGCIQQSLTFDVYSKELSLWEKGKIGQGKQPNTKLKYTRDPKHYNLHEDPWYPFITRTGKQPKISQL